MLVIIHKAQSDHFRYFSALFAASKNFPELIGMAAGFSNVAYGMSPLFLSLIATTFFTEEDTGLHVSQFAGCLAILCGLVNLLGAFTLNTPDLRALKAPILENDLEGSEADETTSLLSGSPKGASVEDHVVPVEEPAEGGLSILLKDPYFWVLVVYLALTLGPVELLSHTLLHLFDIFVVRDGGIKHWDYNVIIAPCNL